MKIKLPQWKGVWQTEIYDEDGNQLFPSSENLPVTPLDYLKKGTNIACLIQFAGIWFVNGKFSASWKLVQSVVQKPKATLQGKCFIQLKSTDKEKLQKQVVPEPEVDDQVSSTIVEDSDEEEEESLPPPPPVQVPVSVPVAQAPAGAVAEEAVAEEAVAEEAKVVKKKIVKKKV
jgi:hypothetical protein